MGTEGGKVETLQYLFGVAEEWLQQAAAARGQLSAVGSTLRLLLSQQSGGGPNLENVVSNHGKRTTATDDMASKYRTETW